MSNTLINRYLKNSFALSSIVLLSACFGEPVTQNIVLDQIIDSPEPIIAPSTPTEPSNNKPSIDPASMPNLSAENIHDNRVGLFAFPGAQGWGGDTRGGAGGNIVTVNTTLDIAINGDGLISLREALESRNEVAAGPRTIVFSVGGLFDLAPHPVDGFASLNWPRIVMQGQDDSHITVACQTAPAPGVNIRGGGIYMWFNVTDHIWRHCTKRNDDEQLRYGIEGLQDSNRAFSIDDFGGNMIFDHMSLSWSTDSNWHAYINEGAQSPDLKNFTISHSIVAEGDGSNPTTPGTYDSAQGPACLNNHFKKRLEGCSFLNNYFAHNETRNGALWGATGESLNNIVYNYRDQGVSFFDVLGTGHTHGWAYNNLIKEGLDGSGNTPASYQGSVVADNNYWLSDVRGQPSGAVNMGPVNNGTPDVMLKGGVGPDIRELAKQDSSHMACLGASKPTRDAHDQQFIDEFHNGSGRIFKGPVSESRDFSIYPNTAVAHPANYDTDSDGIADAWERQWIDAGYTSSLSSMNHLTDSDGDGYLDIEEFINEMARCD